MNESLVSRWKRSRNQRALYLAYQRTNVGPTAKLESIEVTVRSINILFHGATAP